MTNPAITRRSLFPSFFYSTLDNSCHFYPIWNILASNGVYAYASSSCRFFYRSFFLLFMHFKQLRLAAFSTLQFSLTKNNSGKCVLLWKAPTEKNGLFSRFAGEYAAPNGLIAISYIFGISLLLLFQIFKLTVSQQNLYFEQTNFICRMLYINKTLYYQMHTTNNTLVHTQHTHAHKHTHFIRKIRWRAEMFC